MKTVSVTTLSQFSSSEYTSMWLSVKGCVCIKTVTVVSCIGSHFFDNYMSILLLLTTADLNIKPRCCTLWSVRKVRNTIRKQLALHSHLAVDSSLYYAIVLPVSTHVHFHHIHLYMYLYPYWYLSTVTIYCWHVPLVIILISYGIIRMMMIHSKMLKASCCICIVSLSHHICILLWLTWMCSGATIRANYS